MPENWDSVLPRGLRHRCSDYCWFGSSLLLCERDSCCETGAVSASIAGLGAVALAVLLSLTGSGL